MTTQKWNKIARETTLNGKTVIERKTQNKYYHEQVAGPAYGNKTELRKKKKRSDRSEQGN
jgi:hypothetical protein